jgi:hypothetical protein
MNNDTGMNSSQRPSNPMVTLAAKIMIVLGLLLLAVSWFTQLLPEGSLLLPLAAFVILACGYILLRRPEYLALIWV